MTPRHFIAAKSADRAQAIIDSEATRKEYGIDAEALAEILAYDHRSRVRNAARRALKAITAKAPTQ